jgi:glycerol-3-phosphate dehydrogenase
LKPVTVLSAGTWGITLATLLAEKGEPVRVWEYDPAVVRELTKTHLHPKLPGMEIPHDLPITSDKLEILFSQFAILSLKLLSTVKPLQGFAMLFTSAFVVYLIHPAPPEYGLYIGLSAVYSNGFVGGS